MGLCDDHDCPLREVVAAQAKRIAELEQQLAAVMHELQELKRRVLGPKSEKMPPVSEELRREQTPADAEARRLRALDKRRERQASRQKLQHQRVEHCVAAEARQCPACGGVADRALGEGKRTTIYEYMPGYFVREDHVQEKLACRCGEYIATAAAPPKPVDKGSYGAGFVAHLVTMKCADSLPLHRLAKQYQRVGIAMARSTLNDLFHAAAEKLAPLSAQLLKRVAECEVVGADETSLKMQRPSKRGFVWTFHGERERASLIAYKFAGDRSGETPASVLGGSKGALVVDAYTGYNRVTDVDGRTRVGCLAHVRRKFFEALPSAPLESKRALELILDVYRVEHEAKARQIVGTPEHLALRQTSGRTAMTALHQWVVAEDGAHAPKSPLGVALGYARNQWPHLEHFLDDVRIPLDNNASESALRVVALGRKNFLFVGDEVLGDNLAGLYSLVATCEANNVDPVAYLKDVLLRVDTHPAARIDDLLPHKWSPPAPAS